MHKNSKKNAKMQTTLPPPPLLNCEIGHLRRCPPKSKRMCNGYSQKCKVRQGSVLKMYIEGCDMAETQALAYKVVAMCLVARLP